MQTYEGEYRVVAFCRHSYTAPGEAAQWQARADVYHWNDKKPVHCVYSRTGFVTCEAAKSTAVSKAVNWARAMPPSSGDKPD